jgi:hypothetical protein
LALKVFLGFQWLRARRVWLSSPEGPKVPLAVTPKAKPEEDKAETTGFYRRVAEAFSVSIKTLKAVTPKAKP